MSDRFDGMEPIERVMTTSAVIADRIRDGIINGRFPSGSQLHEMQLAEALDVSRGPVREAMQRLIQEGLLRNERHRGVFVVELDADDVDDIYLARRAIEGAALKVLLGSDRSDFLRKARRIVDSMEKAAEKRQWADVADLDLRFHEALVAATGSKRLGRMFQTLLAETRMCLTELEASYTEWRDLVAEHRGLLEALESGDRQRVLNVLEEHLASAVRDLHKQFLAPTD